MATPQFTLTGLTGYVDQNSEELLSASIAGSKSSQVLTIQTGIKKTSNIQILDTDVTFQDDAVGFNAVGVTTLSKSPITVTAIRINEELDVKGLNDTYVQHQLKAGSAEDEIPFEQAWSDLKAAKIASALEEAIWQGEDGVAAGNLAFFDGFLVQILAGTASVIHSNGTNGAIDTGINVATGVTAANIVAIVDEIADKIPVAMLGADDVNIYMGHDLFRLYTRALVTANYFHYDGKSSDFEITVSGTNIKVIALQGMNGLSYLPTAGTAGDPLIVAARASNMVIGVDLEHGDDEFKLWYSEDDRVMKFAATFKYGVAIAFLSEVVEFSLNPVT